MSPASAARVLDPASLDRLRGLVTLADGVHDDLSTPAARAALARAELVVTGWGAPVLTPEVLAAAPRLRAVVHAAGSVRHHLPPAVWDRGVAVSSAAAANAVPVAEFTLAVVLLAGKRVLASAAEYRARRVLAAGEVCASGGNHGATVGVLSASLVGRRVVELLRPHDLTVLVHDPHVDPGEVRRLGAEPVGLLELAERSDVLTVHTPLLPETRGLVDAGVLARLRDGATVVNTARGAVIDAAALTAELVSGRLHAVLDVTDPEPLPPDSPLWDRPNVLLTPHVAGSAGNELRRLAEAAVDEVERFAAGRPFRHPVAHPERSRTA
ncbi:hydroxyacid dehydrogenase [Kineococcus sp. R8]|uniref:hydroxyacid dehydrogenase n=1 Tax=Kineococcus siccus TaxID=2696567 RepID=UPI0014132515|nr:hydroxyacid dehydrogenase [Kineococcus siccus]NAZ81757.1 hydroxyacid dehydrogenase [Kineococcus siccus]